MLSFRKGLYTARLSNSAEDLHRAQRLRHLCFAPQAATSLQEGADSDAFDPLCTHGIVEEVTTGKLVCCFRSLRLTGGKSIAKSYSAQFYDLTPLGTISGPLIELGRFCVHPDCHDPDVLRIAFALLTAEVTAVNATLLFGCASFTGTEAGAYTDTFARLRKNHLAPPEWRPGIKAPEVFPFAATLAGHEPDPARALKSMPPLLRTYLAMGGWVSDHAVIDRQMQTLHVFTGVEIASIPPARARLLRAMAG